MSSISGLSAANYQPAVVAAPKASAQPTPSNDGDADDAAPVAAKPAPGTGTKVDIQA